MSLTPESNECHHQEVKLCNKFKIININDQQSKRQLVLECKLILIIQNCSHDSIRPASTRTKFWERKRVTRSLCCLNSQSSHCKVSSIWLWKNSNTNLTIEWKKSHYAQKKEFERMRWDFSWYRNARSKSLSFSWQVRSAR